MWRFCLRTRGVKGCWFGCKVFSMLPMSRIWAARARAAALATFFSAATAAFFSSSRHLAACFIFSSPWKWIRSKDLCSVELTSSEKEEKHLPKVKPSAYIILKILIWGMKALSIETVKYSNSSQLEGNFIERIKSANHVVYISRKLNNY